MQSGRPTDKSQRPLDAKSADPSPVKVHEGTHTCSADARFAVIASRFNESIVADLLRGTLDTLRARGASADQITVVRTPGAWEIPVMCLRLAKTGKFDAIIALGAVVRGATPHFEYVAGEAARGCGDVMTLTSVPVVFGVLTTDTVEQAIERSGPNENNKGVDAALAALEMVSLGRALSDDDL